MRVVSPDVSRVYMADNSALVRRTTSGDYTSRMAKYKRDVMPTVTV
jgi:hypothetical protein